MWEEKQKMVSQYDFISHLVVTSPVFYYENCFLSCASFLFKEWHRVDMWQVVHVFVSSSWLTYCMKESVTCSVTHARGKPHGVEGLRRLSFFYFNPHIKSKNTSKLDKSSQLKNFISEKNKKKSKVPAMVSFMLSADVSPQWPSIARSCLTTKAKPRTSWTWRKEKLSWYWKR